MWNQNNMTDLLFQQRIWNRLHAIHDCSSLKTKTQTAIEKATLNGTTIRQRTERKFMRLFVLGVVAFCNVLWSFELMAWNSGMRAILDHNSNFTRQHAFVDLIGRSNSSQVNSQASTNFPNLLREMNNFIINDSIHDSHCNWPPHGLVIGTNRRPLPCHRRTLLSTNSFRIESWQKLAFSNLVIT